MDEAIEEGFDVLDALDIPDDVLNGYDQPFEEDSDRPVYIDPGVYRGQLIEWGKVYNPMFKKYSLEMTFALGNERLKGWFNIEKSNSDTLVKAGWKSDFLRMYQEVFDVFLKEVIGKVDYKILASGIIAYKRAKENSLMLYKNVDATLHALSKIGLKLAVVSDAPSREAWIRICTVKLEHTFDAVVTLHDKGFHKPSPEPFNQVIKSLNIEAEEILMVGDWPERDIIGAQNVGMKTAFAKYGDTFDTQNSGADYVLEDISDLIDIINKPNN